MEKSNGQTQELRRKLNAEINSYASDLNEIREKQEKFIN
jgi:uncharacterized protein YlxW (UPF0749 family)